MNHRTPLLQALEAVTAARREYQAELDEVRAAQLATTEPVADDQTAQTLGALVRQLENAAREITDAIRTCDQGDRLRARL